MYKMYFDNISMGYFSDSQVVFKLYSDIVDSVIGDSYEDIDDYQYLIDKKVKYIESLLDNMKIGQTEYMYSYSVKRID